MITLLRGIILSLFAASGLLLAAIVQAERASGRRSPPGAIKISQVPAHAEDYGSSGTLTPEEARRLRGLLTPGVQPNNGGWYPFAQTQGYNTLRAILGFPRFRTPPNRYGGSQDFYSTQQSCVEITYNHYFANGLFIHQGGPCRK
jgi:hypothetical protein